MKVLITGADGFLGKNLHLRLVEHGGVDAVLFTRNNKLSQLPEMLDGVDLVFHLAGVNRSLDPAEFISGNVDLTQELCDAMVTKVHEMGIKIPIIFTSSSQACNGTAYGESKLDAENTLLRLKIDHGFPVHIFRLANVFGKWCKPNYNSVVATFCHNIARGLPIHINDSEALIQLVYIDDVIERFVQLMDRAEISATSCEFEQVAPQYSITVGELARQIKLFKNSRETLISERVGTGLLRALYTTYVSYLPIESFSYVIPQYIDSRGVFVEFLKTPDCGQFSYFTAHPGVIRGGHYHHSKTEKFLVIKGQARFRFRNVQTGQTHELITNDKKPEIVETIPGWTHDIINIGEDEMVVMLWANELFDRDHPDTFSDPL